MFSSWLQCFRGFFCILIIHIYWKARKKEKCKYSNHQKLLVLLLLFILICSPTPPPQVPRLLHEPHPWRPDRPPGRHTLLLRDWSCLCGRPVSSFSTSCTSLLSRLLESLSPSLPTLDDQGNPIGSGDTCDTFKVLSSYSSCSFPLPSWSSSQTTCSASRTLTAPAGRETSTTLVAHWSRRGQCRTSC